MRRRSTPGIESIVGSLVCGTSNSSCSLLAMANPSFWLGAARRVRDGIEGWPVRCRNRGQRRRTFQPSGFHLAGKGLALMHAYVRVGHQRGQVVCVVADNLAGEGPMKWQ